MTFVTDKTQVNVLNGNSQNDFFNDQQINSIRHKLLMRLVNVAIFLFGYSLLHWIYRQETNQLTWLRMVCLRRRSKRFQPEMTLSLASHFQYHNRRRVDVWQWKENRELSTRFEFGCSRIRFYYRLSHRLMSSLWQFRCERSLFGFARWSRGEGEGKVIKIRHQQQRGRNTNEWRVGKKRNVLNLWWHLVDGIAFSDFEIDAPTYTHRRRIRIAYFYRATNVS